MATRPRAAVLLACGMAFGAACSDGCGREPDARSGSAGGASGDPREREAEPSPATEEAEPGGGEAAPRDRPEPPSGRTRVVLLGTGNPNTDPERSGPAVAVVVDDVPYLVDAGPGLVRRAEAAFRNGEEALEVVRLDRVFVTHLHSDHTVGLPDLLFTPWVLGRDRPLHVHGPPGIEDMVDHVQRAWVEDVRVRLEGLQPANDGGHRAIAHVVQPGETWSDERVRVTAVAVDHGAWEHAYAYRFETPDRVVVVSGDTGPTDAIARACAGCDVLVHEVYSAVAFERQPPGWQRYHGRFHTSTIELARIAGEARPELLVLYHHLLWGEAPDDLADEVRAAYDGEVVFGRDLDVL